MSARSTRLSGDGLTFRPGRRPRILVRWPWSASSQPCAARVAAESCGVVAQVRAVASQYGDPGRWCWRFAWRGAAVGCRGGGPETLAVLRASTLCRADDEVALDVGHRRPFGAAPRMVGFFICIRASRVCSSHSSRGVFSLMLANGHPVLSEWGFELFPGLVWAWLGGGCGRGPACVVVWFSLGFSLINWTPS
jgi:hypothetical protein